MGTIAARLGNDVLLGGSQGATGPLNDSDGGSKDKESGRRVVLIVEVVLGASEAEGKPGRVHSQSASPSASRSDAFSSRIARSWDFTGSNEFASD